VLPLKPREKICTRNRDKYALQKFPHVERNFPLRY
jgi:hypothetical protein